MMADRSISLRSPPSPVIPGRQSSLEELVLGVLENPHFQDKLERTTRTTPQPHIQASNTSQRLATLCSTSQPAVFQKPVEEFWSLFRAGTSLSQGQDLSVPRFV